MKKLMAMLLALVMVLSLAACGGNTAAPAATEAPKADAPAAEAAPATEAPPRKARSSTSTPGTKSSRASLRNITPFPRA